MSQRYEIVVGEKITWVAHAIKDHQEFQRRARSVAQDLGPDAIEVLPRFFHHPPVQPGEQKNPSGRLGQWLATCQAAIFEILYFLGEPALPLLRRVAYGSYDWTQPLAIDILCRFAMEGLERERIDQELGEAIPEINYDAVLYSREYLAKVTLTAPKIRVAYKNLIEECLDDNEPEEVLELIEPLAQYNASICAPYELILRQWMRGENLREQTPIEEKCGTKVEEGQQIPELQEGQVYVSSVMYNSVRAALILSHLYPHDTEVRERIKNLSKHYPDPRVIEELRVYLQQFK